MATDFDPGTGLGPRLRLVREGRTLSVRELARRVGCSASLISQVERGLSVPSVGVLYALASELDCSLDFLLFGTGAETRPPGKAAGRAAGEAGARTADAADAADSEPLASVAASRVADRRPGGLPGGIRGQVPGPARDADPVVPPVPVPGPGHDADPLLSRGPDAPRPAGVVQRGGDRRIIDLASGVRWERLTPGADDRIDFLEVIYSPGGHSTDERRPLRHEGREYGLILSGTLRASVGFETYTLNPGDSIAFDSSTPHEYWNTTGDYVHAVWVVTHPEPGHP
jgi:transcriptional regulator with XRE-family HTH domain/mannose-6-phosphate isomerase-like protein (cupin superfamily)